MTDEVAEVAPARRVVTKLRTFIDLLDSDERVAFAALLGPGIVALFEADDSEVVGFGQPEATWEPGSLRDQLATAVSDASWEIVERQDL